MFARALAVWLILVVLAILNGSIRNLVVTPRVGEHAGHLISTVTLSAAILVVAWLAIGWIGPTDRQAAIAVGLFWLALTVLFEFGAGHYVFGNSWARLLADYNVLAGRVWVVVLLVTVLAPVWALSQRGR
jgi:hypothetical protein